MDGSAAAAMPPQQPPLQPPPQPTSKRSVKASKLAKMSEQDRARYLEKRLAEEEESKRRKEEMINAFLRMKLGHEERSYFLNNSKLIERWRLILRQCKNDDLRVDIRTLSDGFARALDRKTAHIDLLLQELSEEEDQYCLAFRSQLEVICRLDQVYTGRMMQVLSRHQDNTAHVLATNARQDHRAEEEQAQHNRMLGDVLIATNQRHQAIVDGLKGAFQETKEEIKNKSLEERQALQIVLEEVMEGLWSKIQESAIAHNSATEEKRRVYQELLARDKKGLADVVENNKRIVKLTEDLVKLKETMGEVAEAEDRRLTQLRKERDDLMAKLHRRRRLVSVDHAKRENRQVVKLSVRVDRMQKAVSDVKIYQAKVLSAVRSAARSQRRLPVSGSKSPGLASITSVNLEMSMLREENAALNNRLSLLKARLGSDLADVKKSLQQAAS